MLKCATIYHAQDLFGEVSNSLTTPWSTFMERWGAIVLDAGVIKILATGGGTPSTDGKTWMVRYQGGTTHHSRLTEADDQNKTEEAGKGKQGATNQNATR